MNKPTKRGRPRSFDEADILNRITSLFWEKGYSATSLDMVSAATGLTRPSLYAAFGSKKDMFLKCLDAYALRANADTLHAAENASDRSEAAHAILTAMLRLYSRAGAPSEAAPGCFAITSLAVETENDPDLQAALKQVLQSMDSQFTALLTSHCASPAEAAELAKTIALLLHGCSVRLRAGETVQLLKLEAQAMLERVLAA